MMHLVQLPCPACGGTLLPAEEAVAHTCAVCGAPHDAYLLCGEGHSVCPGCRQREARRDMLAHCLGCGESSPFAVADELMRLPRTAMHGPEHHFLLPAALLTAWSNSGGAVDLPATLEEADRRSLAVPGGACGAWGACGAALGAGIFWSIVTEATPFSGESWGDAGLLTARCVGAVAEQGGPRCCKRDTFLVLQTVVAAVGDRLAVDWGGGISACRFLSNNRECKGMSCPFFPRRAEALR